MNFNGNTLEYSEQQYNSLFSTFHNLKSLYQDLISPERVIGHENISGWRGKVDPGYVFNWKKFYKQCFHGQKISIRKNSCPIEIKTALENFLTVFPKDE